MKGRVLQIFNRYTKLGGEELSVDRIATHLARQWQVERCLFDSADWLGDDTPPKWRQALWMFQNPHAVQQVAGVHGRCGADLWVVHNIHPVASAAVFAEARRLGVPVLHFLHNYKPFALVDGGGGEIDLGRRWRNFFREIREGAWQGSKTRTAIHAAAIEWAHLMGWYRSIAGWVAISPTLREDFARTPIPEDRLFVLPHAWDITEPEPSFEEESMDYYLYLGRLTEAKGVRTLLKAWQQLNVGAAPPLVIAGEGELELEVKAVAERIRAISVRGLVTGEEKRQLLHQCRGVIAPSRWREPLGIVAYEAFEHGKPVIASAGGGFSGTVEHRVSGRLFEAGDASALAAAVRAFEHAGTEGRTAMGRAGRQWLERETSPERWLDQFAAIAEPIIERYRRRREQRAAED